MLKFSPARYFISLILRKKRQLTDIFKKAYDLSSVAEVYFLGLSLNQGL